MNERQAEEQGLYYTGMSFDRWDSERAERYAKEVKEFKAKYKVRLVKVKLTREPGWYSYYGDDNFSLVHYNTIESLQKRLDDIPNRLERARIKYEEELAEIEKFRLETLDKMEKVKEIMK